MCMVDVETVEVPHQRKLCFIEPRSRSCNDVAYLGTNGLIIWINDEPGIAAYITAASILLNESESLGEDRRYDPKMKDVRVDMDR
jgi:hypothetical protein